MSINLNFDDKVLYKKLSEYFGDNIKYSLKTEDKLFIITKSDIFYEIDITNPKLSYFILYDDQKKIESMIGKDLCNKGVNDLICGKRHYIARTNDNKFYFNGRYKSQVEKVLNDLNVSDVKCGSFHTLLQTSSGEVYAWGSNRHGQIGNGCHDYQYTPIKVNGFSSERVVMISCGCWHSMALTESGHVYSWGSNEYGQLGNGDTEDSNMPKLVELNSVIVERISCGQWHSLLLSKDGAIYVFGNNLWGQIGNGNNVNQLKPVKINHKIKFIDIAAHHCLRISVSLSVDNKCYVWGECKNEDFKTPNKTDFGTFAEVFNNYTLIQYEISEQLIEFKDKLFRSGYFERKYKELETLESGSYGTVVKVSARDKLLKKYFAIKKIKPTNGRENDFVKEFHKFSKVRYIHNQYIVEHFDAWFENNINTERLVLYIKMELCDTTLQKIVEEIKSDIIFRNKIEDILTPIGYYIASQLFIEIVKGVQYLHKHNIIHRDLNPNNILIKREEFFDFIYRKGKIRSFVKIGDFGLIAIHKYAQQSHTTDRGNVKYMAPEVDEGLEDNTNYDLKADIYSLGLILKHLLFIDMKRKYINNDNFIYAKIVIFKTLFRFSLKFKYKKAKKLCNQMTQLMPSNRPDCGIIIKTQNLWALNVNDFKIEDFLDIALSVDGNSETFHTYDILVSKLIDLKCIGGKWEVINYEKCLKIVMDYLMLNKDKPMIVQILSKTLLDYAREYCQIIYYEEWQKKSQAIIKFKNKLRKKEMKEELNIELLEKVFKVTMRTMESFPNNLQIQRNAISLCKQLIYRNTKFDANKCIQLVINSLFTFKDKDIIHLSVKLFSSLVNNLSESETKQLFSNPVNVENNVEKLLKLVEYSINDSNRDTNSIEQILSVCMTITHLSPNVCEIFVEKGGIDLCFDILNTFHDEWDGKDKDIIHLSVKLFSNLVNKLSESETKQLFSNPVNVEKLLKLVENSINDSNRDTYLIKKILSVFMNITDLSPNVCEIFVEKGGIDLCFDILKTFDDEWNGKVDVFGLLSNIAEVPHLRNKFMNEQLISFLRISMQSTKTSLSFFAAEIFAYICSEGIKFWSISSIDFKSILNELLNVILNLKIPQKTFYLRNSFLDLKPLLDCYELPAVQLCAVWEIHFLCSKEPEEYYEMLIEINGHKVIKEIHEKTTNDSLKYFCEQTLNVFDEKYPDLKY